MDGITKSRITKTDAAVIPIKDASISAIVCFGIDNTEKVVTRNITRYFTNFLRVSLLRFISFIIYYDNFIFRIYIMNPKVFILSGILGGVVAILSSMAYYTFSGVQLMKSSEVKKKLKSGEIKHVIDVRTKMEWNLGHYPNAIHTPTGSYSSDVWNKKVKQHNIQKDDGIVVYCNTGQRARNIAEKIAKLGYTKVYYIAGHYSSIM